MASLVSFCCSDKMSVFKFSGCAIQCCLVPELRAGVRGHSQACGTGTNPLATLSQWPVLLSLTMELLMLTSAPPPPPPTPTPCACLLDEGR